MLTGFVKTCSDNIAGGVVALFLAAKDAVTAVTMDTTDTTAVKSVTKKTGEGFAKYEFMEDECEVQENVKVENGVSYVEQKVIFKLAGMSPATRKAVEEIRLAAQCGVLAVAQRKNGNLWLGQDSDYGFEHPLRMEQTTGTTGKKLADASGEEITLSRQTTMKAPYYIGDLTALTTTGA